MKMRLMTMTGLLAAGLVWGQAQDTRGRGLENADPFKENNENVNREPARPVEPKGGDTVPTKISICFEVFSLPLATAAKIQREKLLDPVLYSRIVEMVDKGEAAQDVFVVSSCRSGYTCTVEGISEYIYPTEFQGMVDQQPGGGNRPDQGYPAALPVSFEARNLGLTCEWQPTCDSTNSIIDLRFAPDRVRLAGTTKWGKDEAEIEFPLFESQRINTGMTLLSGVPGFAGTMSWSPESKIAPEAKDHVWLAFVTATAVEVK